MTTNNFRQVLDKTNQWLTKNVTNPQCLWSVINCETLYAKMLVNFADNGEIKTKRVTLISKWPLQDETILNDYNPNQSMMKQAALFVLSGRYIVQLLRVWLQRIPPTEVIEQKFVSTIKPPRIAYKDYWPKMIASKDAKVFKSNIKVMEKMNEVADRINLDIANHDTFHGLILNVITFPNYLMNTKMYKNNEKTDKICSDQIINVIRVFFDTSIDVQQDDLIGFADFIPECISGGGFIKYPKFETQSKLIQKASKWMAQNPEIKFINSNSVDIKLKSSKLQKNCIYLYIFHAFFLYLK